MKKVRYKFSFSSSKTSTRITRALFYVKSLAFSFVSSCSASQDTSIASLHTKTRVLNDPSFNTVIIIVNIILGHCRRSNIEDNTLNSYLSVTKNCRGKENLLRNAQTRNNTELSVRSFSVRFLANLKMLLWGRRNVLKSVVFI